MGRLLVRIQLQPLCDINTGLWCNGSTIAFDAIWVGSSPTSPTITGDLQCGNCISTDG